MLNAIQSFLEKFRGQRCQHPDQSLVMRSPPVNPVTPGTENYIIGSPVFDKVTIHLENGKDFTIRAKDVSVNNIYIKNASLNGKDYLMSFLKHSDIIQGGELIFEMADKPNEEWGTGEGNFPVSSINKHLITPAPFLDSENTVFSDGIQGYPS